MSLTEDEAITLTHLLKVRFLDAGAEQADQVILVSPETRVGRKDWDAEVYACRHGKVLIVWSKEDLRDKPDLLSSLKEQLDRYETVQESIDELSVGRMSERLQRLAEEIQLTDRLLPRSVLNNGIHRSERIPHLQRGGHGKRGRRPF